METNLKFTSAICTSREQSELLLTLGLKKETADCVMMYYDGWHIGEAEHFDFDKDPVEPAWSLHRLIEMMPNKIRVYDNSASLIVSNEKVQYYLHDVEYSDYLTSASCWKSGNIYDNIIDCIGWLIIKGYFNKEYLEE